MRIIKLMLKSNVALFLCNRVQKKNNNNNNNSGVIIIENINNHNNIIILKQSENKLQAYKRMSWFQMLFVTLCYFSMCTYYVSLAMCVDTTHVAGNIHGIWRRKKKTQCNFSSEPAHSATERWDSWQEKSRCFVHTEHGGEFAFRIPFNLQITKKSLF